eukprot:15475076-Alexandrium_andersonii.AAC.1
MIIVLGLFGADQTGTNTCVGESQCSVHAVRCLTHSTRASVQFWSPFQEFVTGPWHVSKCCRIPRALLLRTSGIR